jgi:hypothetical protein
MHSLFVRSLALTGILGLSACGIADEINDAIKETQAALIEEAFEKILDEAKDANGSAVQVGAEGGELAFDEAGHPLEGTKVVIPAAALPEGVEHAVLSAVPIVDFALAGTSHTTAGPAVLIELRSLPELNSVTLVADATVQVPVTGATDPVAVGHIGQDGAVEELPAADGAEGTVAGLTDNFSPFVAVSPRKASATRTPLNRLSYLVSEGGATQCSATLNLGGAIESSATALTFDAPATMTVNFVLESSGGVLASFYGGGADVLTPADLPVTLVRDGLSFTDLRVGCDTAEAFNWAGDNITQARVELLSFTETGRITLEDCGGASYCMRLTGDLWFTMELDFLDSNNSDFRGLATFDGIASGITWDVMP